ncbi:MAG: tetratricopeptide repeat protein [Nitrospirota bacterium]
MKRYLFILLFCHSIILLAGCAPKPVIIDKPLTELIQPETSPQRAASLRLTEDGKAYLQSGNLIKASEALEKAITIDTSNPYAYYYFARLRSEKGEYKQSLGLLSKAEILFKDNQFWLSNVYSLIGRNHESLFQYNDAQKKYEQALKLNEENIEAREGMERIGR